ncbi:MAG: hypothetical protein AAB539_02110 [Patescibacteria group bacterium]
MSTITTFYSVLLRRTPVSRHTFLAGIITIAAAVVFLLSANAASAAKSADLNADGIVNSLDWSIMNGQWGGSGTADLNGDGIVNSLDWAIMNGQWGGGGIIVPPPPAAGIWTSREELVGKPMSGPAWAALKADADGDLTPKIDTAERGVTTDTNLLAAAIVYARLSTENGKEAEAQYYKNRVKSTLELAVSMYGNCNVSEKTLPWAFSMASYPLAADLIGYRTPAFEQFLRDMADRCIGAEGGNTTLHRMFHATVNNWASSAFGSLVSIYRYLGDETNLVNIRREWEEKLLMIDVYKDGEETGDPRIRFLHSWNGGEWHCDPSKPVSINPPCIKAGIDIGGVIPEDQVRGGTFSATPGSTTYPWVYLQGLITGARILERARMPIWHLGDDAIYRAAYRLEHGLNSCCDSKGNWAASGIPFINDAYKDKEPLPFPDSNVYGHGLNTGFPYVLPGIN